MEELKKQRWAEIHKHSSPLWRRNWGLWGPLQVASATGSTHLYKLGCLEGSFLFSIRIVLMLREMALYKWPLVQVVWPFQHAKPALEPAPCQATEGEWPLQTKLPKLFFPVHQRIRPSKRCRGGRRSALQHSPHCLHAAISHQLRRWAASGHLAIFNNIKIIL